MNERMIFLYNSLMMELMSYWKDLEKKKEEGRKVKEEGKMEK